MYGLTLCLCCVSLLAVQCQAEMIDLTQPYKEGFTMHWLTTKPFTFQTERQGYTEDGYWAESHAMCLGEHSGTHLDAPKHFNEYGFTVDQIPLAHLIAPAVVIDIRSKVAENRDYGLTTDDIMSWIDMHGPLPHMSVVFVLTGWGERYGNILEYFGSTDVKNLSFPGISPGAAQLLGGYEASSGRSIVGVGLDTASIDIGKMLIPQAHIDLFKKNIYGLENVANLEKLPTTGAKVMIFPMLISGGSGAPCRILADIDPDSAAQIIVPNALLILAIFTAHYL